MNPPQTLVDQADAQAPAKDDVATEAFFTDLLTARPVMYGPDPKIMFNNSLSERTPLEDEAMDAEIDDVDLVIGQNRLEVILESAKEMLEQTGAAPGAKWGDLTCGLYNASGDLALASSSGVVVFSACASAPLQHLVKQWTNERTVGVHPGDIYYHNDARYGGVHNADQTLWLPIFIGDELVAWAGATIHEGENGATEPGGLSPTAQSVYDEGLKISPVKVGENYTFRRDVVNLIQNNVRDPLMQLIDMRAKLAACKRIEEKVLELASERDANLVVAILRRALERTEQEVRRRFGDLPDGIYRHVQFGDTTLLEDRLLKFPMEVEKRGTKITIRTPGAAPAIIDRAMNSSPIFSRSTIANNLQMFFWDDLPRNAGYVAALDFEFEPGSLLASGGENPNALGMIATCVLHTVMHCCMTKMAYNRPEGVEIIAPWYGMTQAMFYGGLNQWGMPVANLFIDINSMGGGAHVDRDGEHACAPFFSSMADYGEMEERETELPIMALGRNLTVNNHGYGRHRGGSAVECMYMVWGVPEFFFGCMGTGSKFPTVPGMFGGYGGPSSPLTRFTGESTEAVKAALAEHGATVPYTADVLHADGGLPGHVDSVRATQGAHLLKEGDMWILQVGGGGGYGDPLERDPELVMQDLRESRVSPWIAENVYRVVYDGEELLVDVAATEAARKAEREARLDRAVGYDEFVAQWRRDDPPEGIEYLGSWEWDA